MRTAVFPATPDLDIEDAYFNMRMADIRHIPVIDARNQLVGVISQLDLAVAMDDASRRRQPVESIMSREVRYVETTTTVEEVIEALIDHKIGCVPVVDDKHELCGIITATDCLRLALDLARARPHGTVEHTGYSR